MKKASIIILIMLFSILAPFDFSGLNFSFAFGEEANASIQTNNLPMAVDDFYQTDANTQLTVAAPGVLGNDSDPDGDALLSAKLADPANGMVSMGTDGRFMYVPRADFTGTDSFTYTIYDGKGGSATATVTIAVASNATEEKQASETVPLENETKSNSSDKKDSNGTTTDNSSNKDKEKKDANLSDEDKPKFVGEYGTEGQPKTALLATGGSTYNPWEQVGIKPYGQYFKNNSEYVNPKTGQLILSSTDFALPARGLDLVITRIYQTPLALSNGKVLDDQYTATNFGNSTRLDYPWIGERYLYLEGGQQYLIEWSSGTFEYHKSGVHFILTKNGDNTYTLTRPSGLKYQFDTSKKLTRIEDTNGNYLIFTYNGNNMIDGITDTLGREALFTYTNGKVTSIELSDRTVAYTYDGGKLTKATDPDGRETRYEYNSAYTNASWLITKITYPTGGYTEYNYGETSEGVKEIIQSGATNGSNPSMDLDSNNNPHIAYYDSTNFDLIYAKWTGTKWEKTTVDSTGDVGYYCSIDVDSNNRPHIAYYDATNRRIKYAYFNGTSWAVETVPAQSSYDGYFGLSLKLDTSNNPHIGFSTSSISSYPMYVYKTTKSGGYWSSTSYDNQWNWHPGYYPSIDLDSSNNGRISYYKASYNRITYVATSYAGSVYYVHNDGDYCGWTSLDIDSNSYNHVAYTDMGSYGQYTLGYVKSSYGTKYEETVVDSTSSYVGSYPDIVADSSGIPHIAYNDSGNNLIKYAKKSGGSWVVKTIDSRSAAGTAIALDSEGKPHIAYFGPYFTHYYEGKVYRVSSQKIYESAGNLSAENAFAYTVSNDRVTQEVTTTKDGGGTTKSTTTLVFADDGTASSKTVKDASAVQLYKEAYTYNTNKEVTQESIYRGNTATVTFTRKYNYDNWGNMIYLEDAYQNKTYASYVNSNYENSFRDFYGSAVSGFSNSFYAENSVVSDDIHSLVCGRAFDNSGTKIEGYYKYDSKGNPLQSKSKHNAGWIYVTNTFDSWGNIESSTDPLSKTTYFEYDDDFNHAYLTRTYVTVGADTIQSTFDYNASTGEIVSQTDGENYTTYYSYDILGRITEVEYPGSNTKSAVYDDANNMVSIYDENNNYVKRYYDGLGREKRLETYNSSSIYQTSYTYYNYLGSVKQTTDPLGRNTYYTYDALGRVTQVQYPDGNDSARVYNDIANTIEVENENGFKKKYYYDNIGRLTRVDESPDGASTYYTTYQYDGLSNLKRKDNFNGYYETYTYDDLGRLTTTTFKDGNAASIAYNDAGYVTSTTDRKGTTISFAYDDLGRLVTKTYPDSSTNSYAYDKRSLLTSAEGGDVELTYAYDSRGRLTSEGWDINGSTYSTSYGYDPASNITSITYPSTNSYSYAYDDINRITALTGYASFDYNLNSRITSISYQNGVTTSYSYDTRNRPTNIAIGGLLTLNYDYDPAGNVLSLNDWDFTYDRMNRLKTAVSVFDIDYTYDSMGNRTQQVEDTITTNYTYSNMMRLLSKTEGGTSTTFGYDRNGNLTSKTEGNSSYTYVWDYDNRLKEVRQDGNLLFSYTYDPNGRRVRSFNSGTGVTTTYVYAGINVIHEVTSTESTDYLYANGMRIAKKTGATVKYFHSDHLGSTRLVTDSSGQPTFESDYKPFGEDANATGTEKYAFTGQYNEADIGLYYFGARWYDASLGRFISEDPIKGSMLSSQSQNPYVYCMNNPLRFVDPTGMACQHEFRDGGWVDLYENGKIVVSQATGEILENAFGSLDNISERLQNLLATGSPFVWEWSDAQHTSSKWIAKFGEVMTNLSGITINFKGGSSISETWKNMGFNVAPGLTPNDYYRLNSQANIELFGKIAIESVLYAYAGTAKTGVAVIDKIIPNLFNQWSNYQTFNDLFIGTGPRDRIADAIFHVRYGPNAGWDYANAGGVFTQDGVIPYTQTWKEYNERMG